MTYLTMSNLSPYWNSTMLRPQPGDKILIEDAIGIYWGIYKARKGGVVWIMGDDDDVVEWDDIYRWILFPKDEEDRPKRKRKKLNSNS